SPSFLSQVELSQSSPSLASLQRICDALNLDISELLREPNWPARKDPIIRRDDRGVVHSEWSKATMESLLHDAGDDDLGTLLISLEIGAKTGRLPVPKRSPTASLAESRSPLDKRTTSCRRGIVFSSKRSIWPGTIRGRRRRKFWSFRVVVGL